MSSATASTYDKDGRIVVENPVVELDGDEMTRIIWKKIREEVRSTEGKGILVLTGWHDS